MISKSLFIFCLIGLIVICVAQTESMEQDELTTLFAEAEGIDEGIGEASNAEATIMFLPRGVISDIATIRKIGEFIQTVGEKVIPILIPSSEPESLVVQNHPKFKPFFGGFRPDSEK